MADFNKSLEIIFDLEFNDNPFKFLHKNELEEYYTIGGIYGKYHQHSINWNFVNSIIQSCGFDLKRASNMLYYDEKTMKSVKEVYHFEYWEALKLEYVISQKMADEIFAMAIHSGKRNAVKLAQDVIGVKIDGFIGSQTIGALNAFDESLFDIKYDVREKEYYDEIVENNIKLDIYLKGFYNRSDAV